MFSLRDLCFVLCSRDLDVLRAQRIMGIFILITHKSMGFEKSDHTGLLQLQFLSHDGLGFLGLS